MNEQQIIRKMLEEKINEIFLDRQIAAGIQSGDIEPLDSIKMDELTDELAELIDKVLKFQLETELNIDEQ